MATQAYETRRALFNGLKADAAAVLSHPGLETPDHPYIDTLSEMADYATFGVVDPTNGFLYTESSLFHEGVVFAPLLERDIKLGQLSLAGELCRDWDKHVGYNISDMNDASALCAANKRMINPIISVAPRMYERPQITRGITMAHELDHAYWWWHRKKLHKRGDYHGDRACAEQEISAHRLERQFFLALAPDAFNEEYRRVAAIYRKLDFSKRYEPRDRDKFRRGVRIIAFVNFMFDQLGAAVGVKPNDDVIAAMKAQHII